VFRLGVVHLDLPGAGQVYVNGNYAYLGHLPNKQGLGTSIIDISDPRKPRVVSQIDLGDPTSHSHKARVIGDIMIVNSERNMTKIGRKTDELPKLRTQLRETLGRDPNHAEIAAGLGVDVAAIPAVEEAERKPYNMGGFKIYDVSDRAKPRLITFHKTHGIGVHRFDMDENFIGDNVSAGYANSAPAVVQTDGTWTTFSGKLGALAENADSGALTFNITDFDTPETGSTLKAAVTLNLAGLQVPVTPNCTLTSAQGATPVNRTLIRAAADLEPAVDARALQRRWNSVKSMPRSYKLLKLFNKFSFPAADIIDQFFQNTRCSLSPSIVNCFGNINSSSSFV